MRQAEKERKKFQSRILFVLNPSKKIPKKIQQIKKINSGIISIQNGLSEAEQREAKKERKKKNLSRIPFILDPGKKIPKKIAKKLKKLKNLFPALFIAKTG